MLTSKSDTIIAHIFQRKFPLSGDLFLKFLKLFSPTLARWSVLGFLIMVPGWIGFFIPLSVEGQVTAIPTVAASPGITPAPSSNDLVAPPTSEIEKQTLQVEDASSNSESAAVSAMAMTLAAAAGPPPAPTGLTSLMLKEGVYLSWTPAPVSSGVVGYEVYRSGMPGSGYRLVNPKALNVAYFLDGAGTNLNPPQNGDDYFYVVASVDAQGNVSPYSDELDVTPQGLEIPQAAGTTQATPEPTPPPTQESELKIPDKINFQLPADSQLTIQGYKKIEADFTTQTYKNGGLNGTSPTSSTTNVNQELVVNLDGQVGQNVDVHVDYSDVNRAGGLDQTQQQISIVYHGDSGSAIQEVSFGDLQLVLPNTEFAGFNKQLFGIQAKLKFDDLSITSFFAQTKGISTTKVFKGNEVQVSQSINDIQYIPFKYFLISKSPYAAQNLSAGQTINASFLPKPNSEAIWVDAGTGQVTPNTPDYIGPFHHFLPGRDYTIDYTTGTITFITPITNSSRIAVGFVDVGGRVIGLDGNGNILDLTNPYNNPQLTIPTGGIMKPGGPHLIKDNTNDTLPSVNQGDLALSPLNLVNYYSLGQNQIIPPDQDPNFQFQIINSANSVVQTGNSAGASWIYQFNTNLNVLIVTLNPAVVSTQYPERPFANPPPDTTNGTGSNDVYSQTTTPNSLYRMQVTYDTQQSFYNLGQINIVRASENVYLDGRLLRRDIDYSIDYISGSLNFLDKSILTPSSQVVVTFEYSPFGAFSQENILGARAEYAVTDHFFLGSTFLYSSTQQPTDVPQIGSEPNDLTILDADARFDMDRDSVKALTSLIPGLENWTPPLSVKLSGEVAKSYYNPNTFDTEGETGVAMIDNMDGIDTATSLSVNATSWLVSSPPETVQAFLPGPTAYDGSSNASVNNRVRFYNNTNGYQFQTISSQEISNSVNGSLNGITNPPGWNVAGGGGHIFAQTKQSTDLVNVLEFPYSNLTNQRWAGLRQVISTVGTDLSNTVYLQSYIYNDGQDKWIMVDFGTFNEDTNGNGVLDQDQTVTNGVTVINQAHPTETYGIPSYYINYPGNPNPLGALLPSVIQYPGETSSQEGVSTQTFVTEDLNGNGILDAGSSNDNYYEYGIHANWNGWQLVQIPVNLPANTAPPPDSTGSTDSNINYFFHSVGVPNSQVVRTARIWVTGNSGFAQNGYFLLESLGFTHNLWQLEVDPTANADQGVTVNTSKFNVNIVNQSTNSAYNATLRFVNVPEGTDPNSLLAKESALQITYNLSNADSQATTIGNVPDYYATRFFSQNIDLSYYQEMRFDLEVQSFNVGDILFVRIGNDQADYYQYNIPITSAYQNENWSSVIINLDGSGGNRLTVGTPFINRTSQISFGVLTPNGPTFTTNQLWINNLRVTNPTERVGVARRANATFLVGDNFATINTRYREVDSGFTELDQQSNLFQHSTQLGADYSSSAVSLFAQPLVTQFSYTHQNTYTEDAEMDNPNFELLPNTITDNTTGSIGYTKDLGPDLGRLTTVRLSETTNDEDDRYENVYLYQPGVQGNTNKTDEVITLASTYDAPPRLFAFPIGTNQLTESYSVDHATQDFNISEPVTFSNLFDYNRTTITQNYGWTNTTEIFKDLVFTPGYNLSLVDAQGNTNLAGEGGQSVTFTPFQQTYQPKAGLVFRGLSGAIPSVTYTGSVAYDYVSFQYPQFNNANSINYALNLTPGNWLPFAQKFGLTVDAGHTESSTNQIQDIFDTGNSYPVKPSLSFDQTWLVPNAPLTQDYTGTIATTDRINASFNILDWWTVRPTGSWGNNTSILSLGADPTTQTTETLGFTTVWNKKILTIPFINFNLNSAQVQYTYTDSLQYASTGGIFQSSNSDVYSLTLPYDINQVAQGNFHVQVTDGYQFNQGVGINQQDDLYSVEYNQKFLQNTTLHIPFTHWKIKFDQAIEARLVLLYEYINNISPDSTYTANNVETKRYNAALTLNYNALKNLRVGLGFTYEHEDNLLTSYLGYDLFEGSVSAEARF